MYGMSHALTDEIRLSTGTLAPVAGSGSYQNGAWIDRSGYNAALAIVLASTSGGVTGGAVKYRIEDATSSGGAGAAVFVAEATISIPAGPNAAVQAGVSVDLRGARQFIRIGVDSDPTGGSPASIVAATLLLGKPGTLPA